MADQLRAAVVLLPPLSRGDARLATRLAKAAELVERHAGIT